MRSECILSEKQIKSRFKSQRGARSKAKGSEETKEKSNNQCEEKKKSRRQSSKDKKETLDRGSLEYILEKHFGSEEEAAGTTATAGDKTDPQMNDMSSRTPPTLDEVCHKFNQPLMNTDSTRPCNPGQMSKDFSQCFGSSCCNPGFDPTGLTPISPNASSESQDYCCSQQSSSSVSASQPGSSNLGLDYSTDNYSRTEFDPCFNTQTAQCSTSNGHGEMQCPTANHSPDQFCCPGPERPQPLPYSAMDEHFLNTQVESFRGIHASISLGQDHLHEFILTSFSEPVSENFSTSVIGAFRERARQVLRAHGLDEPLTQQLLSVNVMVCIVTAFAKVENMTNGLDQIGFVYGYGDHEILQNYFRPLYDLDNRAIMPVYLRDMNRDKRIKPFHLEAPFCSLVNMIGPAVKDFADYSLLTLLMLLDNMRTGSTAVAGIQAQYLTAMTRRLRHRENEMTNNMWTGVYSDSSFKSCCSNSGLNSSSQLQSCLNSIRELEKIFPTVHRETCLVESNNTGTRTFLEPVPVRK